MTSETDVTLLRYGINLGDRFDEQALNCLFTEYIELE